MSRAHAHVIVEEPDGTRSSYSGPGETIGALTEDELRASARAAALAESPPGSRVVSAEVTISSEE